MQQIFNMVFAMLLLLQVVWIWTYCAARKKETQLLREQERFLGETSVSYTKAQDLQEAIRESVNPKDALMAAEGNRMLDALSHSSDSEVRDYLAHAKNSFFSVFYALCQTVRSLGDIKKDGQSLFVRNIQYIEEEVRMEILRVLDTQYRFSGLLVLCAVPFFLIPFVRMWAVSVESGMEEFYDGSFGMGTTLLCYAATAVGLYFILWLHYPDLKPQRTYRLEKILLGIKWVAYLTDKKISRRYGYFLRKNEELKKLQGFGNIRQFLVRKYVCGFVCMLLVWMGTIAVLGAGRVQLKSGVRLPQTWTVELDDAQKKELSGMLHEEFLQMLAKDRDSAQLTGLVRAGYSEQIRKACRLVLENQKRAYDKIRFHLPQLLLVLLGLLGGYAMPELALAFCRWNVEQQKMEETLRFETMILVLMHYPQMTVEDILDWLESFAELFRRALARAVDSFSYDRKQALRQLKEDAGYEPVGRIADALENCDEVRICDAFVNMEAERNYYMDQYKQKVRAWTGERAALAKITAFVPFLLVMTLKLIVPFVAQGLSQLSLYSEGMTTLM